MAGFIKESTPEETPIVKNDFRHALCIGETGCGKTTSFMLPNISNRIQENYGMLIVDIKGNLHSHVKAIASKHGRIKDVKEIGVPWGDNINIFENISRSLFLDTLSNVHGETKDRFWISSALNIAGQIYDVFSIGKNLEELLRNKQNIQFNYTFNPKSINEILSSYSSVKEFIDACEKISRMLEIKNIANMYKYGISKNDLYLIAQFANDFSAASKNIKMFYSDIDQDNPAAGSGGVLFTLRSLLQNFSQISLDGDTELKKLLERGSIVILRADSFDENITLSVMNILYKRLLIRDNSRPITLFIDEFQRSVSENNIPYIDLFREMNVELIAAMQNIRQLENKIGDTKCNEFLGNILHNYEYANHMENSLDTFEFIHKNKKSLAKPIFLTNKEKVLAQMRWQNLMDNPLPLGWIYSRPDGYKRAIILNVATNKRKYYYILDKKYTASNKLDNR